jgi:hypothetical protein
MLRAVPVVVALATSALVATEVRGQYAHLAAGVGLSAGTGGSAPALDLSAIAGGGTASVHTRVHVHSDAYTFPGLSLPEGRPLRTENVLTQVSARVVDAAR